MSVDVNEGDYTGYWTGADIMCMAAIVAFIALLCLMPR